MSRISSQIVLESVNKKKQNRLRHALMVNPVICNTAGAYWNLSSIRPSVGRVIMYLQDVHSVVIKTFVQFICNRNVFFIFDINPVSVCELEQGKIG